MEQNGLNFIQAFFAQIWRLLTSFYIPGTNLTPAALIISYFVLSCTIKLVKSLFGIMDDKYDKPNARYTHEVKEK